MKRILFVDDKVEHWKLLTEQCKQKSLGLEIHWYASVRSALTLLDVAGSGHFDLVVVDYIGTTLFGDDIDDLLSDVPQEVIVTSAAVIPMDAGYTFVKKDQLFSYLLDRFGGE